MTARQSDNYTEDRVKKLPVEEEEEREDEVLFLEIINLQLPFRGSRSVITTNGHLPAVEETATTINLLVSLQGPPSSAPIGRVSKR